MEIAIKITDEILDAIYQRAKEYSNAKYGSEPDRVELEDNGTIALRWFDYRGRDYDEEVNYCYANDLSEDLDEVRIKRQIELEEERKRQQEHEKKMQALRIP